MTRTQTTRDERDAARKPRELTTRRTRVWRRRIGFAAAGLVAALVARRLRRGRGGRTDGDDETDARIHVESGAGDESADTGDEGRAEGTSRLRRLVALAASAAAAAAVRRALGRGTDARRSH